MNRANYNKFGFYRGLKDVVTIEKEPAFEMSDDNLSRVLNEIFSIDPRSGLPQGDIAYYLSPDGNPQVKQWLADNLLSPRAKQTGTSIEGVTDDLIEEMHKHFGESGRAYAERLGKIYQEGLEYQQQVLDYEASKEGK